VSLRIDPERLERVAFIIKAVAHPLRLGIIDMLDQCEKMCVSELQTHLNVEQALLSHHLSIMRDKGILQTSREGKNIFYSLTDKNITKIITCIQSCRYV
jgi:DNA-binding transcriptional ArsR family regulator